MDRHSNDAPTIAAAVASPQTGPPLNAPPIPLPPLDAPLHRRLLALIYESLLLAAVLMAGALPFSVFAQAADRVAARPLFQLYLLALAAIYFVWQWLRGGQTLPMKTWRLQLVTRDGAPLTRAHALQRLVFAIAGAAALGAGFLWALADRDRRFLHDRLAGTLIIFVPATTASPPRP
jgi:uncharacterized RDD family membrane protein YckC